MQTVQWSLQDAKNKFSALVNAAMNGDAQIVTRRGVPTVAVVSIESFEKLQQQEQKIETDFIGHLLSGPQTDQTDSVFERSQLEARDIDFNR